MCIAYKCIVDTHATTHVVVGTCIDLENFMYFTLQNIFRRVKLVLIFEYSKAYSLSSIHFKLKVKLDQGDICILH